MVEISRNRIADAFKPLLSRVTCGYLSLVFLLLPLVLHNGYLDLMETKYAFFSLISFIYLAFLAVLLLFDCAWRRKAVTPRRRVRFSAFPCFLLAFLLFFALATGFCARPLTALYGTFNRYQGLLTIALYVLCGLCVVQNRCPLRLPLLALCASLFLFSLGCVLDRFALDPFALHRALSAFDRNRYLSSIGNINACAAYLSLLFPVSFALYIAAQKRVSRLLAALCLLFAFAACALCGSESITLGVAAAFLAFPLLLADSRRALIHFFFGCFLCGFTLFALFLIESLFLLDLGMSFLFSVAAKPYICLPAALAALLCAVLLAKRPIKPLPRYKKPYVIALLALVSCVFLALLLFNSLLQNVSLGGLDRFLKFNDAWGTDRGRIWRFSYETYRSFPLLQKLIGGGAGCLFFAPGANAVFSDAIVDTAHNEYLQYLLTCGLCGLAAYFGIVASALKVSFSAAKSALPVSGLWVGALAYAVQASVNIAHPAVTPLFFLFLALLAGAARADGTFSSLEREETREPLCRSKAINES